MDYSIPKKKGTTIAAPHVRPIITLERPDVKEKIAPSEYIEHKCHNDPGDPKSPLQEGNYRSKRYRGPTYVRLYGEGT